MSQKDIGNKIPIYKLKAGKEVEDYYYLSSSYSASSMSSSSSQASRKFVRGDRVSFEGKGGFPITGTIEKIKIKYVLVHADNGQRWNVPGNRLTSVKAEA